MSQQNISKNKSRFVAGTIVSLFVLATLFTAFFISNRESRPGAVKVNAAPAPLSIPNYAREGASGQLSSVSGMQLQAGSVYKLPSFGKIDLGGGNWVVYGEDGSQMGLQSGSGSTLPSFGKIDLGDGNWVVFGEDGSRMPFQAESGSTLPSSRKIDLGAGYWLVYGTEGAQIVSPRSPVGSKVLFTPTPWSPVEASVPALGPCSDQSSPGPACLDSSWGAKLAALAPSMGFTVQGIDLGSGYRLEYRSDGIQIVPPTPVDANRVTLFAPAPSFSKIDLGAGYWLVSAPDGTQIIPPQSPVGARSLFTPAPSGKKADLGAGYWLVYGSQGAQIVPPWSPAELMVGSSSTPSSNTIELGNGYKLVLGPGGWEFVH